MPLRLVLDTNVWLDWLVFEDPGIAHLRSMVDADKAIVVINEACATELARVLGYPLQKWALDAAHQADCMARCRAIACMTETPVAVALPTCADPDDQKFLELAAAAQARYLVSKDRALLALERSRPPLPFRIVTPLQFAAVVA